MRQTKNRTIRQTEETEKQTETMRLTRSMSPGGRDEARCVWGVLSDVLLYLTLSQVQRNWTDHQCIRISAADVTIVDLTC